MANLLEYSLTLCKMEYKKKIEKKGNHQNRHGSNEIVVLVVLPVKGTQNITNNKSDNAKFMIRMLVVDRIIGLKATTAKININKC